MVSSTNRKENEERTQMFTLLFCVFSFLLFPSPSAINFWKFSYPWYSYSYPRLFNFESAANQRNCLFKEIFYQTYELLIALQSKSNVSVFFLHWNLTPESSTLRKKKKCSDISPIRKASKIGVLSGIFLLVFVQSSFFFVKVND